MTRKDYVLMAKMLHEVRQMRHSFNSDDELFECIAHRIADVFQQDNLRFNRSRFIQACRGGN